MPHLGECLGHLHAQAVQQQVVLVLVGREQLGAAFRDSLAHGHDVEGRVVGLTGARLAVHQRPEEVRDAQERLLALARVGEPHALAWCATRRSR